MKYLPFENYVLTTNLAVDEVRNRIINNIESKKEFLVSASKKTSKTYEGTFFNNKFKPGPTLIKLRTNMTIYYVE